MIRAMRKPDLFILGAPKSGTTSLHYYIGQHPDVFLSRVKEPHHFGSDLNMSRHVRVASRDAYMALFAEAGDARRLGEASVFSLASERACAEIVSFNRDARAIALLRNPVRAVWSLHWQFVNSANEDILDLGEALDAEPDRAAGRRIPASAHNPRSLCYTWVYDFPEQVERAFEAFGPERVEVLLLDDLKRDPAGVVERVFRFLEVDPFEPDLTVQNEARDARNLGVRRLLKRAPHLKKFVGRLPSTLRGRVGGTLSRVSGAAPRPPMTPSVIDRLVDRYEPGVARLEALIGHNLSHWRRQWETDRERALAEAPRDERESVH